MSVICNFFKTAIARPNLSALPIIPVRHATKKHWDIKWKKLRGLKVIKLDLPDFHKKEKHVSEMTAEEQRSFFKERGIQPTRPWQERDMFLTCTRSIFEPYVPPEGDGKITVLSKEGTSQNVDRLKKKTVTWKAIRKIREYDDAFEIIPDFIDTAQDIYLKAHEMLAQKDKEKLLDYVTEKAYGDMIQGIETSTIRWKFIKSLETPRVVHARCTSVITDSNLFAQLTVRFHSQQSLAVYDRFGRLAYGSEVIAKDVLEYVVFEKHIVNVYGVWRIHDKIVPDWMPPKEPTPRTCIIIPSGPTEAEAVPEVATAEVSVPKEKPATSA